MLAFLAGALEFPVGLFKLSNFCGQLRVVSFLIMRRASPLLITSKKPVGSPTVFFHGADPGVLWLTLVCCALATFWGPHTTPILGGDEALCFNSFSFPCREPGAADNPRDRGKSIFGDTP